MARKFKELTNRLPAESRVRVMKRVAREIARMPLHELRQARLLTQQQLALQLNINQAAVSKIERRSDMYVSTLRNFVRALGGELEILAKFPDGQVQVSNFGAVDDVSTPSAENSGVADLMGA